MRRLAFGLVVLALGGALLLVVLRSSRPTQGERSSDAIAGGLATVSRRRSPALKVPNPDARRQARRFVEAFLSYEVGAGGSRTERALRSDASQALAAELLAHRPIPPGRSDPATTRITRLRVDPVPGHPDLALVSGEARRPAAPEPFAFLFAWRGGRWLAIAPGE
jgi:hypothetical protein